MKPAQVFVSLILCSARLAAQAVQAEPQSASIEGNVINEVTRAPVRKAQVILVPDVPAAPSDSNGHFAFRHLAAGTYYLQARHEDFPVVTNGLTPTRLLIVNLARDEQKLDVVIQLTPGGSVNGRVLDQENKPVSGCTAQALQLATGEPGDKLYPVSTARSNERGEYRISGLNKGRYYIAMQCKEAQRRDQGASQLRYAAEFYPDSPDLQSATRLTVAAGTDVRQIDFHVRATSTVTVRGRITGAEFEPGHNPRIELVPRDPSLSGLVTYTPSEVSGESGNFRIEAVPAGAYNLLASAEIGGRAYQAAVPVDIGETAPKPVDLPLIPAADISGSVEIETDERTAIENLRIRFAPADSGFHGRWQANVGKDGTFAISNVPPGEWCAQVENFTGYVKSLAFGGQVMRSCRFSVAPGTGGVMRVAVSTRMAQVEGTVEGAKPQDGTNVAVIPVRDDLDSAAPAAPIVRVNQGRFRITGLEPGRYRLYAVLATEAGMLRQNPRVLKALEARGTPLSVEAGARATAQLQLLPAEQVAQAFDEVE